MNLQVSYRAITVQGNNKGMPVERPEAARRAGWLVPGDPAVKAASRTE